MPDVQGRVALPTGGALARGHQVAQLERSPTRRQIAGRIHLVACWLSTCVDLVEGRARRDGIELSVDRVDGLGACSCLQGWVGDHKELERELGRRELRAILIVACHIGETNLEDAICGLLELRPLVGIK